MAQPRRGEDSDGATKKGEEGACAAEKGEGEPGETPAKEDGRTHENAMEV